eukprot:1658040-Amphidinium_carterae.1
MVDTEFIVVEAAEVRQAPSLMSTLLYTVSKGKRVKQASARYVTVDGVERVAVLPRGWISKSALLPAGTKQSREEEKVQENREAAEAAASSNHEPQVE